jgi:GT2 family glycosyltransferase
MWLFIQPGTRRPEWYLPNWDHEPQNGLLCGMVARRGVFEVVGPFDTAYEIGEDTEWLARFKDSGLSFEHIPDVVLRYRRHTTNTTYKREVIRPNLVKIIRATVERQKAADGA